MIKWIKNLFSKKQKDKPTASYIEWTDEKGVLHRKYVIPVGKITEKDAQKYLSEMMTSYSEKVEWDDSMGELKINGDKHLTYNKTIWFPSPDYTDGGVKFEETENKNKKI